MSLHHEMRAYRRGVKDEKAGLPRTIAKSYKREQYRQAYIAGRHDGRRVLGRLKKSPTKV